MDFIIIKRVVFWSEVALTFLLFCFGLFLIALMLSSSSSHLLEAITETLKFTWYLISKAIESIFTVPDVALLSVFWVTVYVGSLFYFSQTDKEKKLIKYIMPLSFVGILLCAVGIFASVFSALANQGAGH